MNTKGKRTERSFGTATRTLLGSAIAVTSFIAAAGSSGISGHIAKSLDSNFQPLADTRGLPTRGLVISSSEASSAIGAREFAIHDQTAWAVGDDNQERLAPDGFYRLSNDQILKVAGGKVYVKSDLLALSNCCWKDWLQKIQNNRDAPAPGADVQEVFKSLLT
jgi:hypothetical protein